MSAICWPSHCGRLSGSGSLAIFDAMRRASSRVSRPVAVRRPGSLRSCARCPQRRYEASTIASAAGEGDEVVEPGDGPGEPDPPLTATVGAPALLEEIVARFGGQHEFKLVIPRLVGATTRGCELRRPKKRPRPGAGPPR